MHFATAARLWMLLLLSAACAPTEHSGPKPAALVAGPAGVSGRALPIASPADVGMSQAGLDRIGPSMQALVDDGRLAGIVTMVARSGRIVHWKAFGHRTLESADPLGPDDIFRIYSMTKPITSVAVMMLVEGGDLTLDDPVSKFVPGFSGLTVLEEDGSRTPLEQPVTIRHLLTHTGGLTYGFFGDTPVDRMYVESGVFDAQSVEDFVTALADLPLLAHPGERWNYSVSTDVLGYIVQVASGQPLEVFLEERIFEPLGMDDTGFWVPATKLDRFTTEYAASESGLQPADTPAAGRYLQMPTFASGGGGLVSTASDYIRFAQMLLQEGQLEEVRLLSAESVRQMRSNQLPRTLVPITLGTFVMDGYGFGLGFRVLVDEEVTDAADHNGIFRWAGLANTFFWIDPEADLIALVWTQIQPFEIYGLSPQFQSLVYDAFEADG